jgi:formylglycine-generating enzyme required for sulfatase activity
MNERKSRYRGVQPYKTSDQQLFFGRDEDIENLHDFILLEKMVVLFGKSGYGKSSLLNAGIVPLLQADSQPEAFRFRPLEVRFTDYDEKHAVSPLETLTRLIADIPADPAGDFLTGTGMEDSLWIQLKRRQSAGNGRFVLLFDQFEEFFSYPPAQQEVFRRQLAELLFTDIPQSLRQQQDTLDDEARRYLSRPMNVKAVFAIRSDRMSQLDSLKDTLPAILHKRYELRPLTTEQASDAIVKPARLVDEKAFDSPAFEYTEDGLQAILHALGSSNTASSDSTAGIEAFQLQIICEYLESRVRDGLVPDLDGNGLPDITRSELPEMDALYENYYHRKLGELAPEDREKARTVLEDILLAEDTATGEGRRKSVDSLDLLSNRGVTPALLDELEKTYLIRQERNTVGGKNYEISHDTLLAPILKARAKRKAEEVAIQQEKDRIEAEERAREARRMADEERRKAEEAERLRQEAESARQEAESALEQAEHSRRRATKFARGAVVLAVLALGLAWYAYMLQKKAEAARVEAVSQGVRADSSAQIANIEKVRADSSAQLALAQKAIAEQKTAEAENNLQRAEEEELRAKAALDQVKKEKSATEAQRLRAEDNYRIAQAKTEEAELAKVEAERNLENVRKSNEAVVRAFLKNARENWQDGRYREAYSKIVLADTLDLLSSEVVDAYLENKSACLANAPDYGLALESVSRAYSTDALSRERMTDVYVGMADTSMLNLQYDTAQIMVRESLKRGAHSAQFGKLYLDLSYWYCEVGKLDRSLALLDSAYMLSGRELSVSGVADTVSLHRLMSELSGSRYSMLHARYYPVMVKVPGGSFDMGSSELDTLSSDDERPVHRVTLSSFMLSATEVTVFQYGLYCALNKGNDIRKKIEWPNSGDNPVVRVSWYDAIGYSNWLSERMGLRRQYDIDRDKVDANNQSIFDDLKWTVTPLVGSNGYRLPTESEWEYAARGGEKSSGYLYAGGGSLDLVGWYDGNSGYRTHSVGGKLSNELGLYDMSGNVWEWCWDRYGYYDDKASANPQGAESGLGRVVRGGGWSSGPQSCRVAARGRTDPGNRGTDLGFRLVLVP